MNLKEVVNFLPTKTVYLLVLLLVFCHTQNTQSKKAKSKTSYIIFFGDSLTEGLGLPSQKFSFVNIIQEKLKKYKLNYQVVNFGLSGDTSQTALRRFEKVLKYPIDIFFLELGANDYINEVPAFIVEKNLSYMIRKVKKKNPKVKILIAGLQDFDSLPKTQKVKIQEYENIYQNLQKKYQTELFPFILQDVAGIPSLNQRDGIHPNIEGHKIIAENIWYYIKKMIIKSK